MKELNLEKENRQETAEERARQELLWTESGVGEGQRAGDMRRRTEDERTGTGKEEREEEGRGFVESGSSR